MIVSLRNSDERSRKVLRFYSEVVNYLLKTFNTYQAIAEYEAAILHYMQPSDMTPKQFAASLGAK